MHLFETDRLIVRQLREDDLEDFYTICSGGELMRYVGDGVPLTRDQVKGWVRTSQENYRARGFGCSAAIEKATGRFVGYCGLVYPPGGTDVELIYGLEKRCWGLGLATELARAMIDYGLERCGLERIAASVDPENRASIRVLEKVGMRLEREGDDENGVPTLFYAIERGD